MEKVSQMSVVDEADSSDPILVFTRVPAVEIDSLMSDPEEVMATVEDMGFDQSDMMATLTSQGGDPGALYYMMEGRWSGEETNFSFERLWDELVGKLGTDATALAVLNLIKNEGRNSQIYNEYGPVKVLTPDQVKRANEGLEAMLWVADENKQSEESQALEDLFDALKVFFGFASGESDFVLVSLV